MNHHHQATSTTYDPWATDGATSMSVPDFSCVARNETSCGSLIIRDDILDVDTECGSARPGRIRRDDITSWQAEVTPQGVQLTFHTRAVTAATLLPEEMACSAIAHLTTYLGARPGVALRRQLTAS